MGIYLGETEIIKAFLGNSEVKSIFLGEVQVYPIAQTSRATYTVEAVDGVTYGFGLNSNGYYESQNKGRTNSYALCKVIIDNPDGQNVYFDCINYAENYYDFGFLGKVGETLANNRYVDSSVFHSFKSSHSASVQTVGYGAISGTIYVKYIKDGSGNENNDSLQFKVRFE